MKKGEKVLLVLGALLIAAGVFVGVTLGWDYSPDNYAYNDIAFTSADTETGECSFVSVQLSELEVNIYSTTDKTVSIAARGAKTPDRVSVVLDGGVLRITEKKPGLFQRLAVSDDDAVILRIPEKWVGTVDAATQSGDVYVSGLVSPQLTLRASSASGAVSASELKVAETQLITTSGNIFVSTTRGGTITAGTTSGYMNISDVKAESASLSSVSGSISVRNAELTGVLREKRDAPEDICRRPWHNKKMFPAFQKESGEHLYIAYYRSFLSSSSTEYGIARLPQPVPMEMCVLRVPW